MNAKKNRTLRSALLLIVILMAAALPAQTTGVSGDSTINQCETKTYTISVLNNSGNPLSAMVVTAKLGNLTGFSYVNGTTSIDVPGGCTVDPIPSGTDLIWDIDAVCAVSPFILNNGETLNITFDLSTDCSAVSGSLNVRIDYEIGGTPTFDETGALSIQVLPGGVTIKKTPNVIPQEIGQDVTWTLTVENTGFGTIKNVAVNDVLGDGLTYVSSLPVGVNVGQTTTWGAGEIPGLASMDPGQTVTINITATVTACELLDNNADARWGCDLVSDCYNTADTVPPSTATASVQRIVKTPLISYTPPTITFDYCSNSATVNFPVTNNGDGHAHDVRLYVDFTPLTVTAVTAPATYDGSCFIIPTLAAGETFNLAFTLQFSAWCTAFPARSLVWITEYEDDCHNHFYPPVRLSSLAGPASAPALSVAKSGAPAIVQIGAQITYVITSAYSGPLSCGSGTTGSVTVVDTIPDGFTVTDAGGGTWVPGGGGSGGTITWTYTPPAALNTSIAVQVPDRTQCEAYCYTTFTNSISATAVDCCGCTLNASSSQTTAIECEELVDSEKTAAPTTGIRCDTILYTNTYVFADNPALDSVDLSQLIFREYAENEQEYVPGSLAVTLSGSGDITACALSGVTDSTPGAGGNLVVDFSNCSTYGSVRNRTLTISYRLTITEDTVGACSGATFYSWSQLDMNFTSGSECLPDGIISEATVVGVDPPAMSLSISGLGQIIDKCQTQTITLTLTQTSSVADPKDVRLVLSGLNYYVVDPGATVCSGAVAPISCTPALVGDDYIWYFADGFTGSGQSAILQLNVQKRCSGSANLSAVAYFDDNCNDDGNYDDTCSATASETPALLLNGDLLIEKNPEVYYATTNTVQWKIYLTNRGSGSAYNVWLDDVLGAGLDYASAVVDNMTGVTVTADQDHEGSAINGCTIAINEMTAGQRREVTFQATLLSCNNLTNDVSTSWGCVGVNCQTAVSDHSTVAIPRPLLLNTNVVTTPADACSSPGGSITLKNAGQTTCYNLQITETLPTGLTYVSGSSRWRINGGAWNGPNAAYDPSPSTSPLQWTNTQIPGLAVADPGDVIEIEYTLAAECPFNGGNITLSTQYENPCGQVFTNADSTFTVAFRAPQVTVTKTRVNQPIACGQLIEWAITVQNTSGYTLPIIWVEDTLDAAYTYDSSVGDPPYTSDNGTNTGQNVTWELRNVNHNDTITLTLRATSDSSPCSPNLDNTVRAWWGCGAADGSSATKPGVDAPDDDLCLTTTGVSVTRTETRQPSVGFLNIAVDPLSLNSCDDSTELTVTISNPGPTDASNVDLVITLPAGLTYVAGSSAVTCGGVLTDPAPEPAISASQLTFYDISSTASNLCNLIQAAGGNDTVTLVFSVHSSCYTTASLGFNLYYYDCCGDTQYNTPASQQITALYPALTVTKTPVNSQVECSSNQTWTVTVTNSGTGNAEVVRIEDTLGDWIDYVSSAPAAASMGGQVYGWEINNLAAGGGSASFTITGQLNPDAPQADCAALLRRNNARATWGCGTTGAAGDGNPNTQTYDCTIDTWAIAPAAVLQMPDLVVTAITPAISCTTDGTFSGSITVTVRNAGDGIAYGGFTVQVSDGNSWTGSGTYGSDLAAGASTTVNINVAGWNPDCSPCTYNFTAAVDSGGTICECNESNNDFGPQSYSPAIPDLEVAADSLAITCVADGQYRISGSVTLRNAGCSGTLTQNVPMRFTLFSGAGCSGSQLAQWTQTFSGVTIPAGSTQTFAITNYSVTANACSSASACQFSIRSEADYANTICECDGTDNTRCSDKTFTIPDLRVASDTLAISCSADGQIRIQGDLVIANDGCGANLAANIPIRLRVYNDNTCSGTNGAVSFTQAGVNIPAGGSQTFAVNRTLARDLCINSSGCLVALDVELDYTNVICECSNANNNYCSPNKTVSIPDLQVSGDTLGVTCLQDGQVRVSGTATIANTGCNAAVAGNLPVRFTLFSNISCGGAQLAQWTETFAGANIAAGGSQVFTITNRDITTNICTNSTACQVSLRIEADPGAIICECNGGNNSRCSNKTVSVPDLRINSVTPSVTCVSEGTLQGTVTINISNIGCGAANGAVVRLTSDCGITFTDQTINLAAGASTTLSFAFTPDIAACTCTFTASADPDNVICECDSTNNSLAAAPYASPIPDLTITGIDFSNISCANDNISGTVGVTVRNQGCGTAANFQVSLATDGCLTFSNQTVVSLAAGASTTLPFNISGSWADCTDGSCQFTAAVDAPGVICEYDGTNNSRSETYNSLLPDLAVSTVTASAACTADGTISGTIQVRVANNGTGPVSSDFRISVNDGQGWSSELWYQADLGGTLPLAAGASRTVTFNWTRNFTSAPFVCNFPVITATVDSQNAICECSGSNNTNTGSYSLTFPNLRVLSITPTCTSDSSYSVQVVVDNNGCAAANGAVVQLSDNDGQSQSQTVNLAAGAQQTLTYSPWPADGNPAALLFTAAIDPAAAICELTGADNTANTTYNRPNLNLVSITPSCLSDDTFQVALVIQNNGSSAINTDFVVRLTDNDGHTSDQNFTAIGGSLPLNNGSQQTVTFNNWVVDCAPTTINFSGTLDPTGLVCESNSGDNTNTGTITVNNLAAVSVTAAAVCSSDGSIAGTMTVTVANTGGNAMNSDFMILVDDGQGWTSELWFQADLGGTLPIAPGTSQSVTFNWTRNFTSAPYVCSFPDITATVDSQNAICECRSSDNLTSSAYSLALPDLAVSAVANAIICLSDGSLTGTTVTVANSGCAGVSGAIVRLTSDCGLIFSDQSVDLAAGESRDVFFSFTSGITGCSCNFSAVIDPDNAFCEFDGSNNSSASTLPLAVPDIEVASENMDAACSNDGSITVGGAVSLVNNGCGPSLTGNIGMRFTLYSEPGCRGTVIDQWKQVFSGVNIASAGGTQNFSVRAREISGNLCSLAPGCRLSVRIEADYDRRICEWDGTDNDRCANLELACLDLAFSDVSWQCDPAGAVTWTLNVTNSGNTAASNVSLRIYDESPALIFERRVSIAAGATTALTFTSASYPVAREHTFRLVIDENNEICECNGQNNERVATVNCPFTGEPRLEIKKTCPPAQQPGGIFRFEIEVRNSGAGSIDDVEIEDVLPAPLQYVSGSSALDGKAIADPSGTTVLTWKIGNMAAGASHILVYSLIAPADADPGRYCNQARALGRALDGRRSESEKTTCCIILRREAAGCCLVIEERPMGFAQYPELALAYIEPYFHTEKAMFTSYAALHLWENVDFEKGSLPDFVRERLKNYAMSNVEELYFQSRLGLTLPDGSLWLSYAGDYPQKQSEGWKEKNTMRRMTPAQLAFELLAMNKAAAREEKEESKDRLNMLIAKKLDFLAAQILRLPERWEFSEGKAVGQKEKAGLYDLASLYFSLVELGKNGHEKAAALGRQLRAGLASLDNEKFASRSFREECLFILALKENGEDKLAAKKIGEFEKLFHAGKATPEDLRTYAMAVYADFKAGGTISRSLFAEMKNKFYSDDIGLFAEPQADFKQKIDLESLAPLILAFESQMPGEKDLFATTLYRTIEETGLFLKKTNLQVQRPPLNLIKNYPFTQEMLPLLTFIKSYDDMAPIFSETAMVQSPHTAPATENLLPVTYTKVFAPQYETATAQIGLLSFSLQQLGRDLDGSSERVIREQGRSLDQSGKKYVRLLLASRAGLQWQGDVFLTSEKLAVKGSGQTELSLEAPDSKNEYSTAVLANKMVAEKIFLENPGQDRRRLETSLEMQKKLLSQFKTAGFVPARFTTFEKNETGELVMLPGPEKADKMTVAKLHYVLPDSFWQQILEKETGVLQAQDLLFLSLSPQSLRPVFEKELRQFLSARARDFAEIAAQVVARDILGLDAGPARKQLADVWDHETGLPLSSRLENMNHGQVFHYQPWQILIYLTATKENGDFQFKRTLDYFTYLLESEWGMNWNAEYDTLPAAEYWLVKESPREVPEAGDLLNFNVRVENRCPDGLTSAGDLPSLFIKADFTPGLIFAGSELPPNLDLFKDFNWGYQGLQKDATLQYTYQVLIPRAFKEDTLQGSIWVRGYSGVQPFGPDSASGDYCESFFQTARLRLLPQDMIPGFVYADRNSNGRKDAGETGIAAIRFKDNRGRLYRSDAEGRFTVPAGQENVAVQIDFRSIPENLVLISPPTQLTNRAQRRELTYALVPCHPLRGFVYLDENRNGACDENEPRLAGILLQAGEKECSSGRNGEFIMHNLPDLWRDLLKPTAKQPLYSQSLALVKIHISEEDRKK